MMLRYTALALFLAANAVQAQNPFEGAPNPGNDPCSVCGVGLTVGNPDAVWVPPIPGFDPVACGVLEQAGLLGFINPITECPAVASFINVVCECTPGEATLPPDDTPAPVVPATPAPVVPATPAPVVPATPAPVVPATPAPVVPATPAPVVPATPAPVVPATPAPVVPATPAPVVPATPAPVVPATPAPVVPATPAPVVPATPAPVVPATPAPVVPATPVPATPSPVSAPGGGVVNPGGAINPGVAPPLKPIKPIKPIVALKPIKPFAPKAIPGRFKGAVKKGASKFVAMPAMGVGMKKGGRSMGMGGGSKELKFTGSTSAGKKAFVASKLPVKPFVNRPVGTKIGGRRSMGGMGAMGGVYTPIKPIALGNVTAGVIASKPSSGVTSIGSTSMGMGMGMRRV